MRCFYFCLLLLVPVCFYAQNCPKIEAIMVDACGTEFLNEFVIISSGDGFAINDLQFGFNPTNTSGASNANINDSFTSCTLTNGDISAFEGCSNIISLGPGDMVPPNSYLILQTSSNADAIYDLSDLCANDACIYVVSNACTRTIGAFTNKSTGSPGPRSNNLAINGTSCLDNATYNTSSLISNADGNYFIPPNTYGVASPNPCVAPPIPPAEAKIPVFDAFGAICIGEASPLPTVSNNGIEGQWVPEFNASQTTTYTFIPDDATCGDSVSVTIEVLANDSPSFSFNTSLCNDNNNAFPALPDMSDNGIAGTWNPDIITANQTVYTFTPNNLSCSNVVVIDITFEDAIVPIFNIPEEVCQGTLVELPNQSTNTVEGSWSPQYNAQATTTYTFTPNNNICATEVQFTINVVETDVSGIENLIPEDLQWSCDEDLPPALVIDPAQFCGVGSIESEELITQGDCNGAFSITRVWRVFDELGDLITTFQQLIEVSDNTPPEFIGSLPQDLVLNCNAEWPDTAQLQAIDNCSDVEIVVEETIVEDPACPQNFTVQIVYTATDSCGNATTHQQLIQFIDNEGPVFEDSLPMEVVVDCGEAFPLLEPVVTDDCDGEVRLNFTDEQAQSCETGRTTLRTWEATDACGNSSFYTVRFIENCEPLIYEGISPNNDGINDFLVIEFIDCYPDNELQVFNRYGTKIKSITNYDNTSKRFDGTDASGNLLITGTYFYVFKYRAHSANAYQTKNGYVYISR